MKIEGRDIVSTKATFYVRGELSLEEAEWLLVASKAVRTPARVTPAEQVPAIAFGDIDPAAALRIARRLNKVIKNSATQ